MVIAFQSTPAIAGRRISVFALALLSMLFQSTPAIAGRRIRLFARVHRHEPVSIHSGHCWPENPGALTCPPVLKSFNPLRPLLAGESLSGNAGSIRLSAVSIHSGHCWPENRQRSRPLNTAATFQSTPAIAGRRISRSTTRITPTTTSFNPLRPLLAGESALPLRPRQQAPVSIHSGHCWPENPVTGGTGAASTLFQSTPAIAGRRIRSSWCRAGLGWLFQSTPAIAGRRIGIRHIQARVPRVSIHSGHCWPENPFSSTRKTGPRSFNPLRPLLAGESSPGFSIQIGNVSIHSGHCWPENLDIKSILNPDERVSIHSGHCWPENP